VLLRLIVTVAIVPLVTSLVRIAVTAGKVIALDATTAVAALPPIDPPVMTVDDALLLWAHMTATTTRRSDDAEPIGTLFIVIVLAVVVDVLRPM